MCVDIWISAEPQYQNKTHLYHNLCKYIHVPTKSTSTITHNTEYGEAGALFITWRKTVEHIIALVYSIFK